jgi:hypothetical protein
MAPAVAARGFPVTAIQCFPCNGGFCVSTGRLLKACPKDLLQSNMIAIPIRKVFFMKMCFVDCLLKIIAD